MRFKIYKSRDSQYYFTIAGGNNEVLATSETYTRKASAQSAIDVIKGNATYATVIDLT